LQIVGVVIIAASIIAVAYFAELARVTTINIHQPAKTTGVSESILTNGITTSHVAGKPNIHAVEIPVNAYNEVLRQEFFLPSSIAINVGDTVIWGNNDTVGHTVTSIAFNSPLIWPPGSKEGSPLFNHTFDRPGVYSYFCQIHPHMSGTVYAGVEETQRRLVSVNHSPIENTMIEIPYDTAYHNKFKQGFFIPANAYLDSTNSRVTWVNNDYVAHTATATDNSFDTKVIEPRESKTLTIHHGPKRIAYYCQIHPWMQASLTISQ
jgi:plastocyanin